MIQISSKFTNIADHYYLTSDGKVINMNTCNYLTEDTERHCIKLKTKEGKTKAYSIKTLWFALTGENYCVDNTTDLYDEKWRFIPHTNNLYCCSNKGHIKSLRGVYARIMKPTETANGYLRLQIVYDDGNIINRFVHTIVCETWLNEDIKSIDSVCHHIDHNPKNNDIENLRIMSKAEHYKLHRKE